MLKIQAYPVDPVDKFALKINIEGSSFYGVLSCMPSPWINCLSCI